MAKILMVIAPSNFRDAEYFVPRKALEQAGHEITTASTSVGEITGTDGGKTESTLLIKNVYPADYEAIVFVGGPGMGELVDSQELQDLAKKFAETGKITSAICVAPAILSRAGLLVSKKATGWSGNADFIKSYRAEFTGRTVEIAGHIITASGPEAAQEFAESIISALK